MSDPLRLNYRVLSAEEQAKIKEIKDRGYDLLNAIIDAGPADGIRERAIAKTKVEEAVMWATKSVTA